MESWIGYSGVRLKNPLRGKRHHETRASAKCTGQYTGGAARQRSPNSADRIESRFAEGRAKAKARQRKEAGREDRFLIRPACHVRDQRRRPEESRQSSAREKQPTMSERSMPQKSSRKMDDELRPEYDFRALRVVARGPGRKPPHEITVRLAPDVAETFPDADSVNEALRFLIRIAKSQMNSTSRSGT